MLLIMTVVLVSASCNNKNVGSMTDSENKKQQALSFASNYLGPKSEVIPNQDSSYFLCLKDRSPMLTYAVTGLHATVILQTQSVRGKVEWHDSQSIIVKERPGVIKDKRKKPSDYHRIINLKNQH